MAPYLQSHLDLEEQNDLAKNPEFTSVIQRLAANLDSEFAARDAEMPSLNSAYQAKENGVGSDRKFVDANHFLHHSEIQHAK